MDSAGIDWHGLSLVRTKRHFKIKKIYYAPITSPTTSEHENKLTNARFRFDASAALRRDGFVESRRAYLTLGLGGDRAAYLGVLARRALGMGGAGISLCTDRQSGFEKSSLAHLALGRAPGGYFDTFSCRALNGRNSGARVGLHATVRHS